MILSVSESGSAPEIWGLSVGRTDTVSVWYAHWHCVSVSVHYRKPNLILKCNSQLSFRSNSESFLWRTNGQIHHTTVSTVALIKTDLLRYLD